VSAPDAGIEHLDVPTDPVTLTLDLVGQYALHITEAAIGTRRKAIEGGFPEQIADAMGWTLWQLMTSQAFQAGGKS